MNWFVLALVAWVCFGLEIAMPSVLDAKNSGVSPSFIIPVVVFVALHAGQRPTLWAALLLGIMTDLLSPMPRVGGGEAVIVGPHALGFMLAAQMTLAVRGMVVRRNPITLVVLSIGASIVAGTVVLALYGIRSGISDPLAWGGARELVTVILSSLYTALSALVMSFALFALTPLFGFQMTQNPRFARRVV